MIMKEKELNRSFLGTGWSFPPAFSRERKGVDMVSDREDIEQSLGILLSTRLGERSMRPDYGCDLTDMIFEPLNTGVKTYIQNVVETAILYHEPRIELVGLQMAEDIEAEGKVVLLLEYKIIITNTRHNYVYPFYLREGTNTEK